MEKETINQIKDNKRKKREKKKGLKGEKYLDYG